jgi:outer membrane protein assembly factor BamA
MRKVTLHHYKLVLLIIISSLMVLAEVKGQQKAVNTVHHLIIIPVDSFDIKVFSFTSIFTSGILCREYINNLPMQLMAKGYPAASADSIWTNNDSSFVKFFLGPKYQWEKITLSSPDAKAIAAAGFMDKNFSGKLIDAAQLQKVQQRLLAYYANNGHPFAKIYLDSIKIENNYLQAILKTDAGPEYTIDSIRIYGTAKISKSFLQHYLGIINGSLYNKERIEQVNQRLLELPYVQQAQPAAVSMLSNGSVLNLYLVPKKSSQFNFLVGFLPGANQAQKFQLTADVNLNLKNALGNGETIIANWQQLQQKSPRLNIGYQHPYIFKSNFGFDFLFDLFKKDSSFLLINGQLGISYTPSAYQTIKLFSQWQNSFLLPGGVDTAIVKVTKRLPVNIDVSATSFGVDYSFTKTDYRLNPRSGNEIRVTALAGLRKIKRNNDIVSIKDASFNYAALYDSLKEKTYQIKARLYTAHYFPFGKQSVLKAALSCGLLSSPDIFRNELFQIGGYRLLRGFDEESIYATSYAVATTEYRIRTALNSYFFIFSDAGLVKSRFQNVNLSATYISGGIGTVLETKLGLLNLNYAVGKRSDVPFSLRQASKIHFGYVNYF